MPQSLANVLVHIVFSTKHRHPFLCTKEVRDVMTGYLIGTLKNIDCPSLQVGVVEDHVHILCNLHRTVAIAKLVEEVKTNSSARIKDEGSDLRDFHWQNGYGVFSVSQSNAPQVTVLCGESRGASSPADISGGIAVAAGAARD